MYSAAITLLPGPLGRVWSMHPSFLYTSIIISMACQAQFYAQGQQLLAQLPRGLLTYSDLLPIMQSGSFRGKDFTEAELPLSRFRDLVRGEQAEGFCSLWVQYRQKPAGGAEQRHRERADTKVTLTAYG